MPPQVQLHQKHAALQAEHGAAKEQAVREVDAERALAAAASAAARWGLICGNGVDALCCTKYAITDSAALTLSLGAAKRLCVRHLRRQRH